MKQYDLSKIMKRAHNLCNNARAKYPAFSEALKKSWKMAKFDAIIAANRLAMEVEAKANEEAEQERREQTAIRSILFNAQLKADRIKREAESKAERMRGEIAARKEDGMLQCRQAALAIAMTILLDLQSGEPPHSKGEIQEALEEMAKYNNLLIDLSKEK